MDTLLQYIYVLQLIYTFRTIDSRFQHQKDGLWISKPDCLDANNLKSLMSIQVFNTVYKQIPKTCLDDDIQINRFELNDVQCLEREGIQKQWTKPKGI